MTAAADRASLRRRMRALRRGLSEQDRRDASGEITLRIASSHQFLRSHRIAFYYASDGEVDTLPLMRRALQLHKHCYLPKLYRIKKRRLWFAPVREGTSMTANRFGIPEPDLSPRHMVDARDLDLIILPLVAFDPRGNRIGMGGGFYDSTLSYLHHRRAWRRPRLVGVAYECQKVTALKPQPWDVPLDAIVTEDGIHAPPGARW